VRASPVQQRQFDYMWDQRWPMVSRPVSCGNAIGSYLIPLILLFMFSLVISYIFHSEKAYLDYPLGHFFFEKEQRICEGVVIIVTDGIAADATTTSSILMWTFALCHELTPLLHQLSMVPIIPIRTQRVTNTVDRAFSYSRAGRWQLPNLHEIACLQEHFLTKTRTIFLGTVESLPVLSPVHFHNFPATIALFFVVSSGLRKAVATP